MNINHCIYTQSITNKINSIIWIKYIIYTYDMYR